MSDFEIEHLRLQRLTNEAQKMGLAVVRGLRHDAEGNMVAFLDVSVTVKR